MFAQGYTSTVPREASGVSGAVPPATKEVEAGEGAAFTPDGGEGLQDTHTGVN